MSRFFNKIDIVCLCKITHYIANIILKTRCWDNFILYLLDTCTFQLNNIFLYNYMLAIVSAEFILAFIDIVLRLLS